MRFFHSLGLAAGSVVRRESGHLMLKVAAVMAGMVGTGLLMAAAVLGMSRLVGPILALALVGAVFLLAAAALWAGSRARRVQPRLAQAEPKEAITEDEAAFAVGFALGRLLLRKLAG